MQRPFESGREVTGVEACISEHACVAGQLLNCTYAQPERVAWLPFPPAGPPDERTGVSTAHRLFVIGAYVEDVQACSTPSLYIFRSCRAYSTMNEYKNAAANDGSACRGMVRRHELTVCTAAPCLQR